MPELPEVETTRRGILAYVEHATITHVLVREPRLRWPVDKHLPKLLKNQRINSLTRRGKYLLFHFDCGCLMVHLGMSGSLRLVKPDVAPKKHDHIDIHVKQHILRYHDPRRFGSMIWTTAPYQHPLLVKLGPEPLSDEFTGEYLFENSRKRKKSSKEWLMDSHVVVGVGNIYANESLFTSGIHPLKAAGKLTRQQCNVLCDTVKAVLERSITQGGTTLRDFVGSDGQPGYFKQQLNVYGRGGQACTHCSKPLKEIRQSNRTSVYCTHCQT